MSAPSRRSSARLIWSGASVWLAAALIALLTGGTARADQCPAPPWPPTVRPIVDLVAGDVRSLTEAIYGEARGESWCGQIAVGWVILNRMIQNPKEWGATVTQVVNKPHQFSPFGKKNPNLRKMKRADESEDAFYMAQQAAYAVLGGAADPTGGATYFHHRNILPNWASQTVVTARIGAHVYRKGK
jgi:spore germination cell wall hydrolase CwlJ-like protein